MLSNTTISAAVFTVADLDRTCSYYRDRLGLAVERLTSPEGDYAMAPLAGNVLVFFEGEPTTGNSPIVVFGVDEGIEAVAEGLAAKGVEFVVPLTHAPDGGLTADFVDPDGHVLSIHQPPADS